MGGGAVICVHVGNGAGKLILIDLKGGGIPPAFRVQKIVLQSNR